MSKYASLTAGILARKGEAEPTATPFADQLLTRVGAPSPEVLGLTPMGPVHLHDEPVAPKKQGFKPPQVLPLDPVASVFGKYGRKPVVAASKVEPEKAEPEKLEIVRAEVSKIESVKAVEVAPAAAAHDEEEHGDDHCATCPGPSADDAAKTFHVNLRLKRRRFVKLKLSSALLRRPVQEIVAEALDDWFDRLPADVMGDCACLKARGD